MDIKIIEIKENYLKMKVLDEDYTLGNIIQKALLDDEKIIGAGFYIPHPLKREMIFEIFFKDDVPMKDWKNIIIEDIKNIREYITKIKEKLVEILDKEGVD